ncbi:MAG TPA: LytTR family DNA-binding domain-containing protein [Ramlibacter sp.]|jgi:two-component system response regulator AlgR
MTLQVLIVDDEPLARSRLRTLLASCDAPPVHVSGEAGSAAQAMELLAHTPVDAVLLDVQMPGADGVTLARAMRDLARPPAIVFVTAHAQHAVAAFELEAIDYLTKPVRLERLQAALAKVNRRAAPAAPQAEPEVLLIQDRGRTERVPLNEVLYLKAELKYVTVRTAARSYILDGSLAELEEKHRAQFIRIHRNALVARRAVRALEKHYDAEEGEGWAVRLNGIDELLAVSRRQLGAVREALSG